MLYTHFTAFSDMFVISSIYFFTKFNPFIFSVLILILLPYHYLLTYLAFSFPHPISFPT